MKENQKAKIERLENQNRTLNEIIQKLNNEISIFQDNADNVFENSSTYVQMKKQIEDLEVKLKAINDSSNHNRMMYEAELKRNDLLINEIQKLNNESIKGKNERGAGRKTRFTDIQIQEIHKLKNEGMTIKALSEKYDCSVGLIHKVIHS